MLDKFLNKINQSSVDISITQKIADYNKEVLETKKLETKDTISPGNNQFYNFNNFQKYSKFEKVGSQFKRPNTYQTNAQKEPKEYIDDGSYFCSYAVGGNTLICYKNKDKFELVLDKIFHPDKNNYLCKRANYFLNDLVKKQKVYIEEMENGKYEIFLDSTKKESINSLLISEGFDNSEPKKSFNDSKNIIKDNNEIKKNEDISVVVEKKEKLNYAYGLFAKDYNTFEAFFNKNKITLKLADLNLDFISKEDQKTCKSMIYDFVSKKNIILKFIKEENGMHFAIVSNKEGECLNDLISAKNFKIINNTEVNQNNTEESCSEEDWDFVSNNQKNTDNEMDIPEITTLPAMFKKSLESKPNSPFAKKNHIAENTQASTEKFVDDIDVPEITTLPAMFKKPLESKPNSPFAKKNHITENIEVSSENFIDDIDVPEITTLPAMFKKPLESKPNSPFAKKISVNIDSSIIQEENNISPVIKKLSFGKR